jgi:methanogenic corrinoid protein MtbC1
MGDISPGKDAGPSGCESGLPFRGIRQSVIDRIEAADRWGADALMDAWGAEHGYEYLFAEVLEPVLTEIGNQWRCTGSLTLAQTYVVAKVAEDMMGKIEGRGRKAPGGQPRKGPAVIGNIQEDFHSLGRKMLGTFLRTQGWAVLDLGNDVPAAAFVDKAVEVGARVIGVSAMMMSTALNIKAVREEIGKRGFSGRIMLAVGGAIFRITPGLAEEVGADGTAASALDAAGLFSRLWEQSAGMEESA